MGLNVGEFFGDVGDALGGLIGDIGDAGGDLVETVITAPAKGIALIATAVKPNPENVAARQAGKTARTGYRSAERAQVRTARAVYGNTLNDVIRDVAPTIAGAALAAGAGPAGLLGLLGGAQAAPGSSVPAVTAAPAAAEPSFLEENGPLLLGAGGLVVALALMSGGGKDDKDNRRGRA